jgi:hypothetical protein
MEKTLDVPIFRVSRTIVTDKFDALYKVKTNRRCDDVYMYDGSDPND